MTPRRLMASCTPPLRHDPVTLDNNMQPQIGTTPLGSLDQPSFHFGGGADSGVVDVTDTKATPAPAVTTWGSDANGASKHGEPGRREQRRNGPRPRRGRGRQRRARSATRASAPAGSAAPSRHATVPAKVEERSRGSR